MPADWRLRCPHRALRARVTARVIVAGTRLKAIGRAGIGVDNIDVPAATERGIVVFNTPDANATTTAELALAHLLSLSRYLPQADRSVRRGEWKPGDFVGTELAGKTVGVIGFGTIGRIVARRCMAFRTRVLAYDPYVVPEVVRETGAEPTDLDLLLANSDYVTLHCPLNDATRNLLDASGFAKMKRGARIINCARGGLIDETALVEALASGHLAGAALDVYAKEPPGTSPLLALDNVVLTPHVGASTNEAQQAVSVNIAEHIAAFLETGAAQSAVNLPRIPSDQLVRSPTLPAAGASLGAPFVGARGGTRDSGWKWPSSAASPTSTLGSSRRERSPDCLAIGLPCRSTRSMQRPWRSDRVSRSARSVRKRRATTFLDRAARQDER